MLVGIQLQAPPGKVVLPPYLGTLAAVPARTHTHTYEHTAQALGQAAGQQSSADTSSRWEGAREGAIALTEGAAGAEPRCCPFELLPQPLLLTTP